MIDETASSAKKPRTRSPAYPAIDLEEAIEKTKILWQRASRHAVQPDVAVTFWGYDSESSAGYSALSALKKFGLIEDSGSGNKRTVRVSDLGISLAYDVGTDPADLAASLKEAALRPSIHAELWKRYDGQLPDDVIVGRYLVVDRKFNEQYVKSFIKQFKKTISFAKLIPGDMAENAKEVKAPESGNPPQVFPERLGPKQTQLSPVTSSTPHLSPPSIADTELPIPLDEGRVARVPYPMSEDTFELLVETLKLWKKRLVKPPEISDLATRQFDE
jgi:hypothetical protein